MEDATKSCYNLLGHLARTDDGMTTVYDLISKGSVYTIANIQRALCIMRARETAQNVLRLLSRPKSDTCRAHEDARGDYLSL